MAFVNLFNMFKFHLFLAKRFGIWKHEGLFSSRTARSYPQARVLYKDGQYSANMPIGNAVDYANVFGGQVVPVEENKNESK